jgi:hypothetical protein
MPEVWYEPTEITTSAPVTAGIFAHGDSALGPGVENVLARHCRWHGLRRRMARNGMLPC